MKPQYVKILRYLSIQMQWVSSQTLSEEVNCSKRSIKTYMKELNGLYPEVIYSSNKGYKGNVQKIASIIETMKQEIPQTQGERVAFILKKIVESKESLSLLDISDELFISDSTIKGDIKSIFPMLKDSNLQLLIDQQTIQLVGKEREKRKLLSTILYAEADGQFFDIERIKTTFQQIDITFIRDVIIDTFSTYHFFTNDYALANIILHIAIALERMKQEFTFSTTLRPFEVAAVPMLIATEIAAKLSQKYALTYTSVEINDLAILLASSGTNVNFMQVNEEQLTQLAGEECLELVHNITRELEAYYYIDIADQHFFTRFTLHLKNLLLRIQHTHFAKNPMTQTMKRECPLIYDCAVHASHIIKKQTGTQINDDEIAYLAFHLGYALEAQKEQRIKISCALFIPLYYNMNVEIIHKLQQNFGNDLFIQSVLTNEHDLNHLNCELLISTVHLHKISTIPTIEINPFFSNKDREVISQKIFELRENKQKELFIGNLHYLLRKEHFLVSEKYKTQQEALTMICKQLESADYVDAHFLEEIYEREEMSSTAFGQVAIPHAIKMNAKRTGIYVLINSSGVDWAGTVVKMVLLIAISKEDRKIFSEVFDAFSALLTEERNVKKLSSVLEYEEFIQSLIESI